MTLHGSTKVVAPGVILAIITSSPSVLVGRYLCKLTGMLYVSACSQTFIQVLIKNRQSEECKRMIKLKYIDPHPPLILQKIPNEMNPVNHIDMD